MYKILNQSGDSTEILLYSLIEGGYTANRLIKALQSSPSENITLRINSDGGETFEGIAIYNYLKDKNVTVIIDGMCASAASLVAMAGATVIMKEGSMFMIHNPQTLAFGESEDMKAAAEMLEKVEQLCIDIYARKTELPREELARMMDAETWLTPTEALTYGFVDEVDSPGELPKLEEGDRIYEDVTEEVIASQSLTFDDGITAERERLRALDELYTPGRAAILNRAKYDTGETAEQIALELLKAENVITPKNGVSLPDVNNFKAGDSTSNAIADMAEYINRRRGI